ncbi:hypothetical protein G7Y89_g8984 [Cudoniella acicularis]|uniref:Protein kinase domain-containing protein n=1 Tax=Cudoniella acicularis TaxID=354080 RepID=A0A8H4RH35_9HELO|nr:hypothetical protein G7Y89_g8984 [Cudoniella acicularis]
MSLSIGQVLRGRAASYHITKVLKAPTVFQAKIVPFEQSQIPKPAQLAVIKHFPADISSSQYRRELHNYSFESLAKSPYIRSMLDLVGHEDSPPADGTQQPKCMVFEWMDTDLWQLPSQPFRSGSQLPRIMAKSLLEALAVIADENGVHTDVNPNNVFLSGVDSPSPVVKLGDLGNLMGAGPMIKIRFQGVVIRAPEVWLDVPITPKADICWHIGLPDVLIFGFSDKVIEECTESWCIGKIIRLVGPIGNPDPAKTEIIDELALAEFLEKETFVRPGTDLEEKFIKVGTIRQELEKVDGPIEKECVDFIESLLVIDPGRRPSAREALAHPWLKMKSEEDADSDWSVD